MQLNIIINITVITMIVTVAANMNIKNNTEKEGVFYALFFCAFMQVNI